MASFAINSTTTVQRSLTASEVGLLGQNGAIMVLNANAITADGNNDIAINGSVMSNQSAIVSTGSSLDLAVGSLGNILSTGTNGVYAYVTASTEVVNTGTISSAQSTGISLFTADTSASHSLVNTGSISGETTGVQIDARGATSTIVNSGTIAGGTYGIVGGAATNAVLEVRNTGTIAGGDFSSFYGNFDDGSGTSSDRVYNTGLMQGDIFLQSGDDLYDGRGGTVQGSVNGGPGDDIFYSDQEGIEINGGTGADTVYSWASVVSLGGLENIFLRGGGDIEATGDDGVNDIRGTLGNNLIFAGGGADAVNGRGGDDEIFGEGGADVLRGGAGNDELDGGGGADKVNGGSGNDILFGQGNNDLLVGDSGDDVIHGGAGQDTKIGGIGADTFVYTDVSESTVAASDVIKDFERGVDVIQLTDINGNEAFDFIGTAAFSGGGNAELRYFVNANDTAFVQMDTDGDGTADGLIRILEAPVLDAGDFLL